MSKTKAGPVSAGRIKSFIERVEKLVEERDAINGDIRDVLAEAKGVGYDTKTLKWLIGERKIDSADRDERDALRDTYAHALGMAVSMVIHDGLSQREAAKKAGVSKSSLNRALAVPAMSQEHEAAVAGSGPGAQPGTSESTRELEFNRRSGFSRDIPAVVPATDGASDVHVQHGSRLGDEAAGADLDSADVRGLQAAHRCDQGAGQEEQPAGLRSEQGRVPEEDRKAAGGHREENRQAKGQEAPAREEQAPPPIQIGAVASHSDGERVASFKPDPGEPFDDLKFPDFLDRRALAPAEKPSHPSPAASGSAG